MREKITVLTGALKDGGWLVMSCALLFGASLQAAVSTVESSTRNLAASGSVGNFTNESFSDGVITKNGLDLDSEVRSLAAFEQERSESLGLTSNPDHVLSIRIEKEYSVSRLSAAAIIRTVKKESKEMGVPPELVLGIISVESGFDPSQISNMGARGLMQVIPKYHKDGVEAAGGVSGLHSIDGGVRAGMIALKKCIRHAKGNMSLALAYYNGSFDDKTRSYSKKVFARQATFGRILKKAG